MNFSRGQTKYSRNWEDEDAYKKVMAAKASGTPGRKLRPEDFPSLTSSNQSMSQQGERRHRRSQDENEPQRGSERYQQRGSGEIQHQNRSQRGSGDRMDRMDRGGERGDRGDRGDRERDRGRDGSYRERPSLSENRRYNNDNSNNNNNRSVNGKRNINYRHNTIEFKNQNRNKNINTESGKNNVLQQQQQMQHSRNQDSHQSSSQQTQQPSHQSQSQNQQQQQQQQQRYNNEIPIASISFTNSKINNASGQGRPMENTRNILNYDNSQSLNYGRNSREKEINQMAPQQSQQQPPQQKFHHPGPAMGQAMSPSNNKLMGQSFEPTVEKNYQHNKLNNQLNNVESGLNNSEVSRSKRYSSLRQRSALEQTQAPQVFHHDAMEPAPPLMPPNQSQHIQNVLSSTAAQSPATVAYIQQSAAPVQPSLIQVSSFFPW